MKAATLLAMPLVALAANRTHYGDPNTILGCLSDEVKAKITGLGKKENKLLNKKNYAYMPV